jgi:hypothetical protein
VCVDTYAVYDMYVYVKLWQSDFIYSEVTYIFVRHLIQLVREILFLNNLEGSSITRRGSRLLGLLLLGTRRSFALEGGLSGSRLQRKVGLLVPGSVW